MDISTAGVERIDLNRVRICLPPWEIHAQVDTVDDRPILVELTVANPGGITATGLADLPIRGITAVAAAAVFGGEESLYRRLATPLEDSRHRRPAGQGRSRGVDHYRRVAEVARQAKRSGRPGGPAEAIAEFWGVHVRTARRWLAAVSRLEVSGSAEESPRP